MAVSAQAIVVSIVLEAAATLLLGAFLASLLRPARARPRAAAIPAVSTNGVSPGRRMAAPSVTRQAR